MSRFSGSPTNFTLAVRTSRSVTHDPVIREALLATLDGIDVEMLLGVRSEDGHDLLRRAHRVRIYVPFGPDWFRYWIRRLAEARGA